MGGSTALFLDKRPTLTTPQAQAAGALAGTGTILVIKIVPAPEMTEHPIQQASTLDRSLGPATLSPDGPEELACPVGYSSSLGCAEQTELELVPGRGRCRSWQAQCYRSQCDDPCFSFSLSTIVEKQPMAACPHPTNPYLPKQWCPR